MIIRQRALSLYIARRFLVAIVGMFCLCFVLIFMIDFIEILRQSGKFGGASMMLMIWMTLLRLPAYLELTLPFTVLVGTIAALLLLSRKSELTVIRAAGVSAWQFLMPGIIVAFVLGVVSTIAYNPMAASARAEAERLFATTFRRESSLLHTKGAGSWLRQDGADGPSVMSAAHVSDRGLSLNGVTILQYDANEAFVEHVEAESARLHIGHWELTNAVVSRFQGKPQKYGTYIVSTYLTPERVLEALGTSISISFWQLPDLIEVAEKAGLDAAPYKVRYELLLARPFLLVIMVLLGATVSLRSFRSGGIQSMVIVGLVSGFGFFLLIEVARQMGTAGLAPPQVAAWVPVVVASCVALTVLLHQEDG